MKFAYYPGCTATSTSIEYDESVREILKYLEIEVQDIPNWTCCGASSAHIIDRELAIALPSRNLALAERMSLGILASCPACVLRHKTAEYELMRDPDLKTRVEKEIGTDLNLSQRSKHVLEVLYQDLGIENITKKVKKPLKNLKVVTYYGCYLVRPPEIMSLDNPEDPVIMDNIMKALGAEVIDWSCKVDCCGGSLSITTPEVVKKLAGSLVIAASEAGADSIVTACGICQANLDMRQPKRANFHPMPIFYFS